MFKDFSICLIVLLSSQWLPYIRQLRGHIAVYKVNAFRPLYQTSWDINEPCAAMMRLLTLPAAFFGDRICIVNIKVLI